MVELARPVSTLVIATEAPTAAAPCGSVTVPCKRAVSTCAKDAKEAVNIKRKNTLPRLSRARICASS